MKVSGQRNEQALTLALLRVPKAYWECFPRAPLFLGIPVLPRAPVLPSLGETHAYLRAFAAPLLAQGAIHLNTKVRDVAELPACGSTLGGLGAVLFGMGYSPFLDFIRVLPLHHIQNDCAPHADALESLVMWRSCPRAFGGASACGAGEMLCRRSWRRSGTRWSSRWRATTTPSSPPRRASLSSASCTSRTTRRAGEGRTRRLCHPHPRLTRPIPRSASSSSATQIRTTTSALSYPGAAAVYQSIRRPNFPGFPSLPGARIACVVPVAEYTVTGTRGGAPTVDARLAGGSTLCGLDAVLFRTGYRVLPLHHTPDDRAPGRRRAGATRPIRHSRSSAPHSRATRRSPSWFVR
ncbi:hypothetical protein DFH09DRAFT_1453880 [Mycena vulgaris]|nr:hypothetical protein DFH09DRAFT_1453880 [Mycena vulgaris]